MIKLPKLAQNEKTGVRDRLQSIQGAISRSRSSYLFFCFLVPAVIMYLIYLTRGIHPFGNGTILVLDLNGQYVYFYEALRNAICGDGSFLYTFFRGLGGEFMGMYAYYLASPLSYLVALFPADGIQEALLVIILLKVGLCGTTFGYYLHKNSRHPSKLAILTFSVLYALSAYAVVYQNNIMWIDALIWLPLLAYSIEQLIKNRRYKLFVISLSMTVMSNYYIGYMVCIFVLLYFFYYCFAHSPEALNPHKESCHMGRSLLRIILFSAMALAIAAFVVLGAYYSLGFGKSDFSNPNWSFSTKFDLLDFFTKFLPGSYDTVRPEGLPYVYCGVLSLLLVPAYFLTKKIPAREKIASVIFIVIFVVSFLIHPLDLIWHGFQKPNWLNYRYSFMLIFFLLVLAYKGFGNLKQVGERFIVSVGGLLILFTLVCSKLDFETYVESNSKLLELETVWLTVLSVIVLISVLGCLIRAKTETRRNILTGVLAGVVCIEVFCSSVTCLNQFNADVRYSTYSNYNNFLAEVRPIVEEVEELDSGFYRMEKLNHRKYNDNMALGIRGLSNSTSTLNAETIAFLNKMGYTARAHLSQYRGGNPVNDSLLGIKYLIYKNEQTEAGTYNRHYDALEQFYTPVATEGSYTAYQNPYVLSIAYGVADGTKELDLTSYDTYFERLNGMITTMLGTEEYGDVFRPIRSHTVTTSGCKTTTNSSTITYKYSEDTAVVTFKFTTTYSGEYYFYPANNSVTETDLLITRTVTDPDNPDQTMKIVSTKKKDEYLGKDTNTICSLGWLNAGETVEVSLSFESGSLRLKRHTDYFWYIDRDSFAASFEALQSNPQFQIGEDYEEDHLTGTIQTTRDDQMIQTTIPFDEGWKVYVDGEAVETYSTMDALIAFDIASAGDHTLELKYSPDIYSVGMIVSLSGLLAFVAVWVADRLIRKRRKEAIPDAYLTLGEPWILADFEEIEEDVVKDQADSPSLSDEPAEASAEEPSNQT